MAACNDRNKQEPFCGVNLRYIPVPDEQSITSILVIHRGDRAESATTCHLPFPLKDCYLCRSSLYMEI